jgi:hypothetical protein
MTNQQTLQLIGMRHAGLGARDVAALAKFYQEVGLCLTNGRQG